MHVSWTADDLEDLARARHVTDMSAGNLDDIVRLDRHAL
jgi:hypothetical protein